MGDGVAARCMAPVVVLLLAGCGTVSGVTEFAGSSPPAGAALPPVVRVGSLAAPAPARGAVSLGSVPGNQQLHLDVVLSGSDQPGLDALLAAQQDPSSPQYHRWLTPTEFAARFGPAPAEVSAVVGWLRSVGLRPQSLTGSAVAVSGPASDVSRALGTPFVDYRAPGGTVGYVATRAPLVPAALAPAVTAIVGLQTLARPNPHLHLVGPSVHLGPSVAPRTTCAQTETMVAQANNWFTLAGLGGAYQIPTLTAGGLSGTGQRVGVYELAAHSGADTTAFEQCFGLSNAVNTVSVDGGPSPDPNGTLEADLDAEQVAQQAPGATVVSYEGPNNGGSGPYDVWNAMITGGNPPAVISTSWGLCEADTGPAEIAAEHALFAEAAAQGQSIFAAAGDQGSEDCSASDGSNQLQTDYPASDPLVTAVGGTTRSATSGNEVVWNDCQGFADYSSCTVQHPQPGGGGGGVSRFSGLVSHQPEVQAGYGAGNQCQTTCREVPDLSSNSGTPELVDWQGSWWGVGGTSTAAPLVAGLVADRDQGCSAISGDFASSLYQLTGNHDVYGSALSAITSGDNDVLMVNGHHYSAGSGYNPATGLGTPLATGLTCPDVTSVQPSADAVGAQVTVNGFGLEHAAITFGGVPAQVLTATATQATVIVPNSTSGNVAVGATDVADGLGAGTMTAVFDVGGTPPPPPPPPPSPPPPPGIVPAPAPAGYNLVASDGGVFSYGASAFFGSMGGHPLNAPIVSEAATADGRGYWFVATDGGVFNYGDADFFGSMGATRLNAPIVGMAPDPVTGGYWLVASDGGVFAFDAPFFGSMGGSHLNAPIVGMAATPDGKGYWFVAADGGIFNYGDAHFFGSMGGGHLNARIVGMAATPDGKGYWFVALDGGIFNYGDAAFYGSAGDTRLNAPIVGITATPDGKGYWCVGTDGGIFNFGDAPFLGSMGGTRLNAPVVSIVGVSTGG